MTRVLHGEQRLTLHAALAPEGDVISDTRTHSIIDKGEGRGAIVNIETIGRRADDGAPLFTMIKRSEEHTSELQSLMRISYAVFCLKKKHTQKEKKKKINIESQNNY